jgi:PIN domain nuclease of toxin-antitoxin system
MKYLLDTHTLIWLVTDTERLSLKVKKIFEEPGSEIFVSAISFWEVSLKFALGKLELVGGDAQDLFDECKNLGFKTISIEPEICASFSQLNVFHHRDPFGRMLIWQAITKNYTLITKDSTINLYKTEGLKTIW